MDEFKFAHVGRQPEHRSAAEELDVKAIVTDTLSGRTARYLSAFRSAKPVFAKCHDAGVKRELALSYGVYADVIKVKKNKETGVFERL